MVKVLVIGDSCIDEYIYCTTDRFCPDAPVPVLKPESYVCNEGMAGNVADNLRALGAKVDLVTNTNQIKKTRFVDSRTNHMFIRIDEGEGDIFPITQEILDDIEWEKYDAIIISDYCKGYIDESTIKYITQKHSITFLDTKKIIIETMGGVKFIKINDVEYEFSSENMADWWKEKMIITRGSKGAEYKDVKYPVDEVDVRDTSGAGDTFLAGLVYAYISEKNIESAIEVANKCATQVVQKKGTAKINKLEL